MRSRLSLLLAVAAVLTVSSTVPARAHTEVQRAVPAPGEVVADEIDRVELQFLDPVLPTVRIAVATIDGESVASQGDVVHSDDGRVASVSFAALSTPGNYVVEYDFVAIDGDAQSDAYRFTYAPEGDDVGWSGVGLTMVGAVGLGLVGAVAVAVRRRRPRPR